MSKTSEFSRSLLHELIYSKTNDNDLKENIKGKAKITKIEDTESTTTEDTEDMQETPYIIPHPEEIQEPKGIRKKKFILVPKMQNGKLIFIDAYNSIYDSNFNFLFCEKKTRVPKQQKKGHFQNFQNKKENKKDQKDQEDLEVDEDEFPF